MKKILGIIVLSLCLNSNSYAKIKSKDITFPGKYYTKEIKVCSAIPKDKSFSNQSTIDTVKSVIGFEWSKHHTEYSNSILVDHTAITTPIKVMIAATHLAVGNKNKANINQRMNAILEVNIDKQLVKIEKGFTFLATVGSTAPFIGLFGTVWGIMNSFQSIAISRNTSLAIVAPGIAEALFATALGLLAAIPAVVAYNKFNNDSKKYTQKLENFSKRFISII